MSIIFITATNTDIGKSFTAVETIKLFSRLAPTLKLGVFKPIETGVEELPLDASLLLKETQKRNKSLRDFTPWDITSYTFKAPASPFIASKAENISIDTEKIEADIFRMKRDVDILIVEGAGGLAVPITKEYFILDLIKAVADYTLLVTHARLGSINDTILSMGAMRLKGISFDWVVNVREEERADFKETTEPFFREFFDDYEDTEIMLERFVKRILKQRETKASLLL